MPISTAEREIESENSFKIKSLREKLAKLMWDGSLWHYWWRERSLDVIRNKPQDVADVERELPVKFADLEALARNLAPRAGMEYSKRDGGFKPAADGSLDGMLGGLFGPIGDWLHDKGGTDNPMTDFLKILFDLMTKGMHQLKLWADPGCPFNPDELKSTSMSTLFGHTPETRKLFREITTQAEQSGQKLTDEQWYNVYHKNFLRSSSTPKEFYDRLMLASKEVIKGRTSDQVIRDGGADLEKMKSFCLRNHELALQESRRLEQDLHGILGEMAQLKSVFDHFSQPPGNAGIASELAQELQQIQNNQKFQYALLGQRIQILHPPARTPADRNGFLASKIREFKAIMLKYQLKRDESYQADQTLRQMEDTLGKSEAAGRAMTIALEVAAPKYEKILQTLKDVNVPSEQRLILLKEAQPFLQKFLRLVEKVKAWGKGYNLNQDKAFNAAYLHSKALDNYGYREVLAQENPPMMKLEPIDSMKQRGIFAQFDAAHNCVQSLEAKKAEEIAFAKRQLQDTIDKARSAMDEIPNSLADIKRWHNDGHKLSRDEALSFLSNFIGLNDSLHKYTIGLQAKDDLGIDESEKYRQEGLDILEKYNQARLDLEKWRQLFDSDAASAPALSVSVDQDSSGGRQRTNSAPALSVSVDQDSSGGRQRSNSAPLSFNLAH